MNKVKFKRLAYILSLIGVLIVTGCADDIPPEITELQVSRLFSPTDIDARVINQTSLRLTWKAVKNATSYNVEVFENGELNFTGNPFRSVSGVTYDQLPLVITGFAGETAYSVRVQAIGANISESTWIPSSFITDAEQIFYPVDPEEITATGVTLRWPAGEFATAIILTPGDIHHNITADEVAAGTAIITGLNSETEYVAKLMNGENTRGTAIFTTLVDLGGAIPIYPEDDLNAAVLAASDGETLVLFPGEYTIHKGDIAIHKSITIKGLYPHNKPILYNRFVLYTGVSDATFMDLELIGNHAEFDERLPQAINFEAGNYHVNSVIISGCLIHDYGRALIYSSSSAIVKLETLTIHNCILSNIVQDGGDFIDFRGGHVVNLNLTNTTFNRVAAAPRDFIRLDNSSGSFPGSHSKIIIDRCTFYHVSNSRRILYVRFDTNDITVSRTIFAGADTSYTGYFTNQSATAQPECLNNNYYNAPAFLEGVNNGKFDISGTHTTHNPGFVNAEARDFTVTNENLIIYRIGDPRWLP